MTQVGGGWAGKAKATSLGQGVRRAVRLWQGHDEIEYRQVEALVNLHSLLQPTAPLPPTRGWAASPDVLLYMARDVLARRPAAVVEFGSGVSTVVLGLALRKIGSGQLTSFDHDATWLERTVATLEEHELGDVARVVHAPLAPWHGTSTDGGPVPRHWYGSVALPDNIGLAFIDGPPAMREESARFPAFEELRSHLAPGAKLVIDDAKRPDERAMVERWRTVEPSLTVEWIPAEAGLCVVTLPAE